MSEPIYKQVMKDVEARAAAGGGVMDHAKKLQLLADTFKRNAADWRFRSMQSVADECMENRAAVLAGAAAIDRLAALERELAEARKDGARLTHIIEESNKGKGWLTSDVWDKAAALCPIDPKEADNVQKWVRAVIDAAMGGE